MFPNYHSRIAERVFYYDKTESLRLAYCTKHQAWTITVGSADPCEYIYISSSTVTFDVQDLAGSAWYAWDFANRRSIPADLYLRCDDCDASSRGNCHSESGTCVDNECVCLDGKMGVHCSDSLPTCEKLRIDQRTNPWPYADGVWFSDRYSILRNKKNKIVSAQHRPVYVTYYYDQDGDDITNVDFMLFNGRRWVVLARYGSSFNYLIGTVSCLSGSQLLSFCANAATPVCLMYRDQVPASGVLGGDERKLDESGSISQRKRRAQGDDELADTVLEAVIALFGNQVNYDEEVLGLVLDVNEITFVFESHNIFASAANNVTTYDLLQYYRPYFFSGTVDALSPDDTLTPIGLQWYRADSPGDNVLSQWHADTSRPLETIFLCAACDSWINPCMNKGECNAASYDCTCSDFYIGSMCEKTKTCHEHGGVCLNNGTCASWQPYCDCTDGFYGSLCQYATTGLHSEL